MPNSVLRSGGIPAAHAVHAGAGRSRRRTQVHRPGNRCAPGIQPRGGAGDSAQVELAPTVMSADVVGPMISHPRGGRWHRPPPRCHGSRGRTARGRWLQSVASSVDPDGTWAPLERTAAGFVDAARVGDVRTRQHHPGQSAWRPRDVCLGARHLVTELPPRCRVAARRSRGSDHGISSLSTKSTLAMPARNR